MAGPKPRNPIMSCIAHILLFFVIGIYGVIALGFYTFLIEPDLPHGGDIFEDRRGLLRVVPEPVLKDIAEHIHFRGMMVVEVVENGQHDLWLVGTSRFATNSRPLTRNRRHKNRSIF